MSSSDLLSRAAPSAGDIAALLAEAAPKLTSAPPLAPAAPHGEVRPLEAGDIPAVAAVFQKSFRTRTDAAPPALARYLHQVFLEHPLADAEMPSRVHVGAYGRVDGFIGILPARMQWRGRPVRTAVAGSLMVDDPQGNPLAGAKLLRAFLKGPQDLSISETANPISQRMWERLGGTVAPTYSMEWVRVLRPFGTGAAMLRQASRFAAALSPLATGLDRLFKPVAARLLADPAPDAAVRGADVGVDELLPILPQFAQHFALRPDWDAGALRWMLEHAREKERHGPLFCRAVHGRGGKLIGCYLYYGRPRDIAWALQVLAQPGQEGAVIDDMLAHAAHSGFVAVRGRTQPRLLDALQHRGAIMLHRASTVVTARDPELVQAVRCGDALLTGLAAESWSRLIGGTFA